MENLKKNEKSNGNGKKSKDLSSNIPKNAEPESSNEIKMKSKDSGLWKKHDSVIYKDYGTVPSEKVYAFDIDDTIITTKSGKTFATNKDDWVILYPTVKNTLQKHYNNGYKIIFVSNQSGIGKGKVDEKDWKYKIDKIQQELEIPIQVFAATEGDYFRKPSIGLWIYIEENHNGGIKFKQAAYIGDAAGRPKSKTKPKKDFSDTDYKFAINNGLEFQTPEVFFLGDKAERLPDFEFDIRTYKSNKNLVKNGDESKLTGSDLEMVIFVGSPGSGKSTFFHDYYESKGYGHINQDTLKTEKKCADTADSYLSQKKSCVIDNTNPKKEKRAVFIKVAKKYNAKVRCIVFDYPKDLIFHLNSLRDTNPHRNHYSKSVADVIVHTWYKNFEKPSENEGINEVVTLNFVPGPFKNPLDEKVFFSLS